MNTFEEFKHRIGLLRKLDESGDLDGLAQSIGIWDHNLSKQAKEVARHQLLEAHTRLALIDPLFDSLGWKFAPNPDSGFFDHATSAIEVPVTPKTVRRWMDYLGFEHDGATQRPKLMIEAKRYRLRLPVEDRHCPPERHPFREKIREFASGKSPDGITSEWHDYLADHLDYLRGLEARS